MKMHYKPTAQVTLGGRETKLVAHVPKSFIHDAAQAVLVVGGVEMVLNNFAMIPDMLYRWAVQKGKLPVKVYNVRRSASAATYDFFWKDCNTAAQHLHLSDLGSELYGRSYKESGADGSRDGSASWLGVKLNQLALNNFLDHSRRNFALCGRTRDGVMMTFGDVYWPEKPAPVVAADAAVLCLNHVAAMGAYGDVERLIQTLDSCGLEGEVERGGDTFRGVLVVKQPSTRDDAVAIATVMACGVAVYGEDGETYAGKASPLRKLGVWPPVKDNLWFDRDERDIPATRGARVALQKDGASPSESKAAEWLSEHLKKGDLEFELEVQDA